MIEKFQFKKFNPTQEEQIYAQTMLNQIIEMAPDNSGCHAVMSRLGDTYAAWIELASPNARFTAEAKGGDSKNVMDLLYERIREKIGNWRKSRKFRVDSDVWPADGRGAGVA